MFKWLLLRYTPNLVVVVSAVMLATTTLFALGCVTRYEEAKTDASDRTGVTKLQQIGLTHLKKELPSQ
jgi:hypothetical protein